MVPARDDCGMFNICDDDIKFCPDEVETEAVLDKDTENETVVLLLVIDMITELELRGAAESTER